MTTPVGGPPDNAYVVGDSLGQDVTEQSARTAMTTMPVSTWEIAQQAWKSACRKQRNELAKLKDGQFALNGRLDLLEETSGYGSAVMRNNWNLPYDRWITLPFDVQLGPVKGVEVSTPEPDTGFLTLKKGGLWRVDTHLSFTGMALSLSWVMIGNILMPQTNYHPIYPTFRIEVFDASGQLITMRRSATVAELHLVTAGPVTQVNADRSESFNHTFILPEMPDEDDPDAPNHWAKVKVSVMYKAVYGGVINESVMYMYGGTGRSALIASRWSPDVANVNYVPEVPDGGDLG